VYNDDDGIIEVAGGGGAAITQLTNSKILPINTDFSIDNLKYELDTSTSVDGDVCCFVAWLGVDGLNQSTRIDEPFSAPFSNFFFNYLMPTMFFDYATNVGTNFRVNIEYGAITAAFNPDTAVYADIVKSTVREDDVFSRSSQLNTTDKEILRYNLQSSGIGSAERTFNTTKNKYGFFTKVEVFSSSQNLNAGNFIQFFNGVGFYQT
jgi:hypothetical protein